MTRGKWKIRGLSFGVLFRAGLKIKTAGRGPAGTARFNFVPVYAMAAIGARDAERIPICTPDGLVWFEVDDEGRPIEPIQKPQKPCHFCLSQATPIAPSQGVALATNSRPSDCVRYVPEGELVLSNPSTKAPSIRAPPPTLQ
jgi:hypothetical protein